MTTVRIEHAIASFDLWKAAFDRDPADRVGSGVLGYSISRPIDDPNYVMIDLEFTNTANAEAFVRKMQDVWQSKQAAPALAGRPQVRVVERVPLASPVA